MKILHVDHVSKLYRLGEFGAGTLREDLNRLWARLRGKEDPTIRISDQNIRNQDQSKYLWALIDISFSLYRGETLGLIGKNGAGKSTLLKIISKITRPTHGAIYLNGSISSILQVGTGFNAMLTGKENIYMSGATLGMTRLQINRAYDDIVEFSGVRRFIDTPVSRYSSGMYLRLAFSVAAHLQSDILILDEVLAVGDYEFRNKALNHIKTIAQTNRTVIYVAHQLETIRKICSKVMLLEKGRIKSVGDTHKVLQVYTEAGVHSSAIYEFTSPVNHSQGYVERVTILGAEDRPCDEPSLNESWKVKIDFKINEDLRKFNILLRTSSHTGVLINVTRSHEQDMTPGHYAAIFEAKGFHLGVGTYSLSVALAAHLVTFEHLQEQVILQIAPAKNEESTMFTEPEALVASPFKCHLVTQQRSNKKVTEQAQ